MANWYSQSAKSRETISLLVEVANQSVVTSGIYERSLTEAGRVYHHLLDPTTGYPLKLKWPASQLSRMLQWMVRFGQRVYLVINSRSA